MIEIFVGLASVVVSTLIIWAISCAVYDIVESRKEKIERAKYKHCKKCKSRLSEWVITTDGYMECYSCGTVSEHKWHQPTKEE